MQESQIHDRTTTASDERVVVRVDGKYSKFDSFDSSVTIVISLVNQF